MAQVWQRLPPRLSRSAAQARHPVTARAGEAPCAPSSDGVPAHLAYTIGDTADLAGDATRVCLIDVPAGAQFELPVDVAAGSAWLVNDSEAWIGGVHGAAQDYPQRRAGNSRVALGSDRGARLMLRGARPAAAGPEGAGAVLTTRADQMAWQPLVGGISHRLLAPPQGAAAAYPVRMAAGAAAPAHRHGRAEVCFLLDGGM